MSKKRINASTAKGVAEQRKLLYIEAMISNGGNKREAALKAGAKNDIAADQYAARMSRNVTVQAEITRRQAEVLAKAQIDTGISVNKTLREVGRLSYVDLSKCFDAEGNALEIHEIPEDVRAAIAGFEMVEELELIDDGKGGKIKQHKGWLKKFKFHDKNAALEKLMKHFGQYREDNAQLKPPTVVNIRVQPVEPAERRR